MMAFVIQDVGVCAHDDGDCSSTSWRCRQNDVAETGVEHLRKKATPGLLDQRETANFFHKMTPK